MRRGLKPDQAVARGGSHLARCTDLPDEEGTETVLAEDGEIDLEKKPCCLRFAACFIAIGERLGDGPPFYDCSPSRLCLDFRL